MVPLWMVASAIACGNTVVLKPSEKDPSAAIFLAKLFQEAGLPDGVLNVVHGDKVAVDTILDSPAVRAVSFVGSTPIAKSIYERASANGKRVQALGGAKNHMVVMPDADLAGAADAAVSAAYGSAGERCMAVSVLVAVGDVADELVEAVRSRMGALVIGDGTDAASEMGPLITREHRDKVASYVTGATAEGATVVVDGTTQRVRRRRLLRRRLADRPRDARHEGVRGRDLRPRALGRARRVLRGGASRSSTPTASRNGTAIFTRDGGTARQFEFDIEVGMVGVNVPIPVPIGAYSFGGWKNSLFGDSHIYGPESVHFYTRSQGRDHPLARTRPSPRSTWASRGTTDPLPASS